MARFWAAVLSAGLLWAAAPAWAEGFDAHTRLVVPVVNNRQNQMVMSLDHKVTTPGHRYLQKGGSITLSAVDPAYQGMQHTYYHFLEVSQVGPGVGRHWCRVKMLTGNIAVSPGNLLTSCAAASNNDLCRVQVYNDAQTCFVMVSIH